jgi:hypothetical protein
MIKDNMTVAYFTPMLASSGKKTHKIHTLPTGGEEIAVVLDLAALQWKISKGLHPKCKELGITSLIASTEQATKDAASPSAPSFNIRDIFPMTPSERIEAISAVTANAIISDSSNCVVVTGCPGIGKSYEVVKVFDSLNYEIHRCVGESMPDGDEDTEPLINTCVELVVMITGSITEAALFKVMTQYPNAIIVFDDVSDIFRNQTMVTLLMQATDTASVRTISWIRAKKSKTIEFRGKLIFLTNKKVSEFHPAIRSRASGAIVAIDFTKAEMLDLLTTRVASPDFLPRVELHHKRDAIEFIAEWINHPQIPIPNLRTLIATAKTFQKETEVALCVGREPDREFTKRSIIMSWLANN